MAGREPAGNGGAPTWAPALAWTVGFFAVPILLYLAWAWTRGGVAPAECLQPVNGACPVPRTKALSDFIAMVPGLAGAIALSLLTAIGLRLLGETWRAGTVGLSAAIIGAGIATLIGSSLPS